MRTMSNYKERAEKSNESTSNIDASFSWETCGKRL
jgi:hypothetical protein